MGWAYEPKESEEILVPPSPVRHRGSKYEILGEIWFYQGFPRKLTDNNVVIWYHGDVAS